MQPVAGQMTFRGHEKLLTGYGFNFSGARSILSETAIYLENWHPTMSLQCTPETADASIWCHLLAPTEAQMRCQRPDCLPVSWTLAVIFANRSEEQLPQKKKKEGHIILWLLTSFHSSVLNKGQASSAVPGKRQLWQGSGKQLPHPLQCRGLFQRFLLCLSITHQTQIVAAEGKMHPDQRSDPVWPFTHGCLLELHAGTMLWEQSHACLKGCSSEPRAQVKKQWQQPQSSQLWLIFYSQGKVDLKASVTLGRGWKQTKKGRGRIKVILNH